MRAKLAQTGFKLKGHGAGQTHRGLFGVGESVDAQTLDHGFAVGAAAADQTSRAVAHRSDQLARGKSGFNRALDTGVGGQVPHRAVTAGEKHRIEACGVDV